MLCQALEVSESGYDAWKKREPSQHCQEDARLSADIQQIFLAHRQVYGSPRIHAVLKARGIACGRKRVVRLMQQFGLEAVTKKRRKPTTRSTPGGRFAPKQLNREFVARVPHQKWVTDTTGVETAEGWLDLAAIVDLFSRMVVGWAMAAREDEHLGELALRMALATRHPPAGLLHHSDRGSEFTSERYQATRGQPFYLTETLKALLESEVITPALQENGIWGLVLRTGLLAQTPGGELIPSSLRELIRSQLARLTPSAWAFLVAGAVLRKGLTFERLCRVAQIHEQEGLYALEELLRSGLLCEGKLVEDAQAFDEYTFPREVIREVVYREAGATRQRLVQQRISAVMQEVVEDDQDEEARLPHITPVGGRISAKTRNGWGRRVAAGVFSRDMRGIQGAAAKDSRDVTRRHKGAYEKTRLARWERSAGAQAASAFPRPPPGSPGRAFFETRWGVKLENRGGKSR